MKATKFFRLKAEWEKAKLKEQPVVVTQEVPKPVITPPIVVVEEPKVVVEEKIDEPVIETITLLAEEVKLEEKVVAPKTTKKKITNEE